MFRRLLPIKKGDRWLVSFCFDAERLSIQQPQKSVGVDVGLKAFATLSNNQVFEAPKPLNQAKNFALSTTTSSVQTSDIKSSLHRNSKFELTVHCSLFTVHCSLFTVNRQPSTSPDGVTGNDMRAWANQRKTYDRISHRPAGISCVRKDFLNKLTTPTAKTFCCD